jgi:hypothetical protein
MKYIIRNLGVMVVLALFIVSATVTVGCHKQKDSIAVITVVDSLNKPVSGAVVKLTAAVKNNTQTLAPYLPNIQTTGSDGVTYHHFPLEAVLAAEVSKGSLKVTDMVRLKKEDTVTQTIVLK